MAEVVQSDRREAGSGDQALEEVGHLARMEPGAVFLGEDVAGLDPGRTPFLAVLALPFTVALQDIDGVVVECDHAVAAVGLGIGRLDSPAVLDELGGDGEGVGVEVEAGDILVKPRRGPSGDLLGYAVGRPGDLNKDGEQIYHPGGKIAPDLSLPKLKARLETSTPEEHPTARRNRPATAWHQATEALDTLHTEITGTSADDGGDARAQAHITALGELIEATAQKAPADIRAQLHAVSRTFARAQRSQIRAEDRAAHALRSAARDIVNTATGPDASALAALTAALLWAAILAARWHEAKGHAHQADAARQAVQHLQSAADDALSPTLTELAARPSKEETRRILANDVRAAVPEHAERILSDPGWPALATVLADAEAGGHKPHQLLKEAAARRELGTAHRPARVLITRIQHTSRNPAPNRRAEAARLRSTTASAFSASSPSTQPRATTAPTSQPSRPRR